MAIVQGITLISLAVDGDINVLCGVLGGAENGDKRVGGGVERRADWANRCESNRFPPPPNIKPNTKYQIPTDVRATDFPPPPNIKDSPSPHSPFTYWGK